MVIADDRGFGNTKVCVDGRIALLPSVVSRPQTVGMAAIGLKLGVDISLIAHDDELPLLKPENFSTPLTTTRSSLRAAGKRIGERLIAMINQSEPAPPEQELWKVELVVRASTGPAPA